MFKNTKDYYNKYDLVTIMENMEKFGAANIKDKELERLSAEAVKKTPGEDGEAWPTEAGLEEEKIREAFAEKLENMSAEDAEKFAQQLEELASEIEYDISQASAHSKKEEILRKHTNKIAALIGGAASTYWLGASAGAALIVAGSTFMYFKGELTRYIENKYEKPRQEKIAPLERAKASLDKMSAVAEEVNAEK